MKSAGTIWITGLSASGKSSLAGALTRELQARGISEVVLFDGDEFRARLDRYYGHTLEDRFAVLGLLVEAVCEENLKNRAVVVAAISHKRAMRVYARRRIGRFMEVYLDCPSDVCSARDQKGLYRRAIDGEFSCFPGVTEPYERSAISELVLDTATISVDGALRRLLPKAVEFLK